MSDKTIRGKLDATLSGERIRYTPRDGFSFAGTIQGPKDAVRPLLNALAADGYTFEYSSDSSPVASVSFDRGGDPPGDQAEQPAVQWEYFANRMEVDLLESDLAGELVSGIDGQIAVNAISDDERRKIRAAIQSPVEGQSPALTDPNAIEVYLLMLSGVRAFRVNVPTLRRSMIVSNRYAVQVAQTNVHRIFTTQTLAAQESVPSRLFALPSNVSTKEGFKYGWQKSFPDVQASGNKWQVSQSWEYGLWSVTLYGDPL